MNFTHFSNLLTNTNKINTLNEDELSSNSNSAHYYEDSISNMINPHSSNSNNERD